MPELFNRVLLPAGSLCQRELIRFVRQRTSIVGALVTPILFWVFIGAGMGHSFHAEGTPGGGNFLEFFFPGTLVMILLFTVISSTISTIEDRREGFLQSVLVAPVSRMAVVLGKVLGGTILATAQGLVFLILAPLIGIHFGLGAFLAAVGMMLIMSFALMGVGFCIAWRMNSTVGFHVIMNLLLMPMWFLSGSLFPASGAKPAMKVVMGLNPLSYGVSGLRQALYLNHLGSPAVSWALCVGVSVLFAIVMFALASGIAGGRVAGDLQ